MRALFEYNWQVRNDWFNWGEGITEEELLKERVGGVGGILKTLLHIVDVEYSWLQLLRGQTVPDYEIEQYGTLAKVKDLSAQLHPEVESFIQFWNAEMETQEIYVPWWDETFTYGAILRHVIVHEIHHVGQLSVWSREIGQKPVTANLLGREVLPVRLNPHTQKNR